MHVEVGDALAHPVVHRDERAIGPERDFHRGSDALDALEKRTQRVDGKVEQRLDVVSRDDEHVAGKDGPLVEECDRDVVVEHDMRGLCARDDGAKGARLQRGLAGIGASWRMPRIAPLPLDDWDEEVRPLGAGGMSAPDGAPLNIFATLANHPKLLRRWVVFANHVLSKSSLSARDRELLILRTGWNNRAPYEWGQHVAIALRSDITQEEIDRIPAGPDAPGWEPFDATLLRLADELHEGANATDATWATLAERYSTQQLMDAVFAVGQYTLVSYALNTFGVEREAGVVGLPSAPG